MITVTHPDFLGDGQSFLGGGSDWWTVLLSVDGCCDLLRSKLFMGIGTATLEVQGSVIIQFFLRATSSP